MASKAAEENAAYRAAHPETNWGEVDKHMGTAWKQDPGYKARREFFPAPLSTRNSRVPVQRLNARRGVETTFVRPNAINNSPNETRLRTFENNFMNHIKKNIENVFDTNKSFFDKVTQDTNRLQAEDCSRDEAILIYDEYMAYLIIFISILLYCLAEYTRLSKANPTLPPVSIARLINIKSFIDNLFIFGTGSRSEPHGVVLTMASGSALIAGLYSPAASAAILAADFGIIYLIWPVLFLGMILAATPAMLAVQFHRHAKTEIDTTRGSIFLYIQKIINTLFDTRNKHRIETLRGDLRYWGLTEAQVEYLFTVNDEPEPPPEIPPFNPGQGIGPAHNIDEEELENQRNVYREAVAARERDIATGRETRQALGHRTFGIKQFLQFIKISNEGPKLLAPNKKFSIEMVRAFKDIERVAPVEERRQDEGGAAQGGRSHKKKTRKQRSHRKRTHRKRK